jgi:hypothetical protein
LLLLVQDFENVEVYQYTPSEEPIMMPRPDERQARTAAKKSGLVKAPPQQAAFAAQNLEDMLIYDADRCSIGLVLYRIKNFPLYPRGLYVPKTILLCPPSTPKMIFFFQVL